MRYSFEQNIRGYNEIAKDRLTRKLTDEQHERLRAELQSRLERAAYNRATKVKPQKEIYRLQEEKQGTMQWLDEQVAALDDLEHVWERHPDQAVVVKTDEGYVVQGEGGDPDQPITIGEMITDMDWGVDYFLDPATVERNLRKRYFIELARHDIALTLDKQITIDETSSHHTHRALQDAYQKRSERSGLESGFLAESMVKSFLKKLSYDHDADFDILEADAFDDVTRKVDFILRRRKHHRGVGVEEVEKADRIGIQFTADMSRETRERKEAQLDRVRQHLRPDDEINDLILVAIPAPMIKQAYQAWKKDKAPGGPDKLWDVRIQEQIFRGVMEGILSPTETEEEVRKIHDRATPPAELSEAA
jgi:hypothetical protein